MKKQYTTCIEQSAETLEKIIVSGGKIGIQLELSPQDLQSASKAAFAALIQ